ncbi:VOC family protein [Micromonospora globbae]|jgi:predicted enzyme related to lactoylglutathione lyase|uniref:VOC family protein n=1 Tax=Micromonospora globbae TaxID=1894969 RepID=A0A420F8R4_9ACTN|nr:VOC family protein [Micromonospora globbae]RKF29328.1 VOC family protein [Micromonospora globbae]WTF84414.1 VOC family protein [Micromonospora globbae]
MLRDAPVQAALPASDMERAKRFYRDTLGLTVSGEAEDAVHFESGGTRFFIYPTSNAGQAPHTLAAWLVADLDAEMADLRGRGVTFEEYDLPGLRTVDGVAEFPTMRGAWFKDSEGNILGVTQPREG